MRKVISLIIGFCFLVNNVSFALSPPVVSGGLGEYTTQNKDIAFAQSKLAYALGELDKLEKIVNETDQEKIKGIFKKHEYFKRKHSYKQGTVFNSAKIIPYFNMLKRVGGNIFRIPMVVDRGGKRSDYQLLFSTIKGDEKCFPTYFLTDEEFKKLESSVSAHNKLPYMKEKDAKFVNSVRTRYTEQNENILDELISDIITGEIKGGDFTEVEGRRKELEWSKKFPDAIAPKKYLSKNFFSYFENAIDPFLSQIDEKFNLKRALDGKNLCLIKLPPDRGYPQIEENGEKVRVFGHTSNNVVYLFLLATDYDILQKTEFTADGKIKGQGDAAPLFIKVLFETVVHEIGVIYGSRWFPLRNGENRFVAFGNKFDHAYDKYLRDTESGIEDALAEELRQYISRGPVTLDELFWTDPTTGEFVPRDHAMGKSAVPEFNPGRKLRKENKKQLAMAITRAISGGNKDKFQTDEKFELYIEEFQKDNKFFHNINMRFQMYLDAVIAYYLVNGETPSIVELDLTEIRDIGAVKIKYQKNEANEATFSELLSERFPEEIDIALRREVVSIVRKVISMDENSGVSMSTLKQRVGAIYSSYRQMMEMMLDQIQYRVDDIFTHFYGTKEFHIGSLGFKDILIKSMFEIYKRETNPYWKTVEEDLASSRDADNTVAIEPDYDAVLGSPELKRFSDKTGKVDEDFELKNKNGKDLLEYVSKTYSQLNALVKDDTSSLGEWFEKLPEELKKWIRQKYDEISKNTDGVFYCNDETGKKIEVMFLEENKDITLPLFQVVKGWIEDASEMKIFIEKDQFFASPRTMEISHVRRGLLQEDTGVHVGEYYLREFLGRKASEKEIVEDLFIFMLNEAMHVGNSIIKHGEIKSLDDFNEKIEHIDIPAVEETREKWVDYTRKPWEPMADADKEGKGGIFVGKASNITAGLERAKEFISNDDERALVTESARGDGKSHFAKAVREMMGIESAKDPRYYKIDCAEISALGDNKYIHDLFFGKLSEKDGSILEKLLSLKWGIKKSLLVFDHIEKANSYILAVLKQLLNDAQEIRLENNDIISIKNLKILILSDTSTNFGEMGLDLKNKIVTIPAIKNRTYHAEGNVKSDIMNLAEKFNFDYSKKKKIPLAYIEKDLVWILHKWSEAGNSEIGSIRKLEEVMERLTQTRKILYERVKNTGSIGRTNIFGEKLPLSDGAFKLSKEAEESIKFEDMFSPYLITVVDLLYSGLYVPERKEVNEKIEKAMMELHSKFQRVYTDSMIYPYFIESAPAGFYYGPRYEQPGMTESSTEEREEKNPYWQEIKKNLEDFVKGHRVIEVIRPGTLKSVDTGVDLENDWPFDRIDRDQFFRTVNEAYGKLDLWADMETELELDTPKKLEAALTAASMAKIILVMSITPPRDGPYTPQDVMKKLRSDDMFYERAKYIVRYFNLPREVQFWIFKKYVHITKKSGNDMFNEDDKVSPRLVDYVTERAGKARKSVLTIMEKTFFVSPATNTLMPDDMEINQDTSRVCMGEYFIEDLLMGADDVLDAEEFAVVFLNAGMHMENVNVRHGQIENVEDIGTVIDHISASKKDLGYASVSEKYEKAARAWWKYMENPYPWQAPKGEDTFLPGRILPKVYTSFDEDFIKGDVRSVLIQGEPGSGVSQLVEDISEGIRSEKHIRSEQTTTLNCKELLKQIHTPDGMRTKFFGGYDRDGGAWKTGIFQGMGYSSQCGTGSPDSSTGLLILEDVHVLVEALKDKKRGAKVLELATIFQEILGNNGKIQLDEKEYFRWIDASNLKIIFVSNQELSGEISGILDVGRKVTIPELWNWENVDIAGQAEEFSREESEKVGLSWAPLEENTAGFIIDHVKQNKFQIKDLQKFMQAVVSERAVWMREWEKTGTIPKDREDKVAINTNSSIKYFSPYFTSLFFVSSEVVKNVLDTYNFNYALSGMVNSCKEGQSLKPYFKEFAPLDAKYKPTNYYSGSFRSETDGAIFEHPSMKNTSEGDAPKDPNLAITEAVMAAMDELPKHYRKKNGTNHEDVTKAMHEVPYLKDSDVGSVMDYMEELFAGYLFRGDKCGVEVKKNSIITKKMKNKNKNAKMMEKAFRNPPQDFDEVMFIDIFELDEDRGEKIKRNILILPPIINAYNLDMFSLSPVKYHICVALKKTSGTDKVESIHIEMRSNEALELEHEFDISAKTLKNSSLAAQIIQDAIQEHVVSKLIALKESDDLPGWIDSAIEENVIDLYRFAEEKGALVFSENVTFKNGVGALLSKLVKAGIKVAVVARTPEQINAINALNQFELAESQEKIVILADPSEARNTMKNTGHFYYFCVKEDEELDTIPNNDFSVNDITGMVKQIIEALGRASGINLEAEISALHTAAKKFAQSV